MSAGHFARGRYAEAAEAARKAIQTNPVFSISYFLLVVALAKLGQTDEAKVALTHLLELQPSFSVGRLAAAVGMVPGLSAEFTNAAELVGLPA
jgi:Flp pilus assembly protein TadD